MNTDTHQNHSCAAATTIDHSGTDKCKIVEKRDHLAVHGYFQSRQSAERHLVNTIPLYVLRGYFMDKTLTANDFEIL